MGTIFGKETKRHVEQNKGSELAALRACWRVSKLATLRVCWRVSEFAAAWPDQFHTRRVGNVGGRLEPLAKYQRYVAEASGHLRCGQTLAHLRWGQTLADRSQEVCGFRWVCSGGSGSGTPPHTLGVKSLFSSACRRYTAAKSYRIRSYGRFLPRPTAFG